MGENFNHGGKYVRGIAPQRAFHLSSLASSNEAKTPMYSLFVHVTLSLFRSWHESPQLRYANTGNSLCKNTVIYAATITNFNSMTQTERWRTTLYLRKHVSALCETARTLWTIDLIISHSLLKEKSGHEKHSGISVGYNATDQGRWMIMNQNKIAWYAWKWNNHTG